MPRPPRVTAKEFLAARQRVDWAVHNVTGSHHRLRHPDHPTHVAVPIHGKDLAHPKTSKSIPQEARTTADQLRDAL